MGAADEGLGGEDEDEDDGGAFAMEDQMQAEIDGGEVRLGALPALKRKGGALAFTGQVDALESLLEVKPARARPAADRHAAHRAV